MTPKEFGLKYIELEYTDDGYYKVYVVQRLRPWLGIFPRSRMYVVIEHIEIGHYCLLPSWLEPYYEAQVYKTWAHFNALDKAMTAISLGNILIRTTGAKTKIADG